ncbi:hypothetical protein F4806DRAFT_476172, partial [Annulohypoxylon nitens]
MAAPMAVYWPLPSVATVTAGRLLVVDVDKGIDVTVDDDERSDEEDEVESMAWLDDKGVTVVWDTEYEPREELEIVEALVDDCPI